MEILINEEVKSFLKARGKRNMTIYSEIPSGC